MPEKSPAGGASSSAATGRASCRCSMRNGSRSAERGLQRMLEVDRLDGLRFLDIGSGSGLSSLAATAARRARALIRLRSAVGRLHQRTCDADTSRRPRVDRRTRLGARRRLWASLGQFDIVLFVGRAASHRTDVAGARERGDARWPARQTVRRDLQRYGQQSRRWQWIKRTYNALPGRAYKAIRSGGHSAGGRQKHWRPQSSRGEPGDYVRSWTDYRHRRGMNKWHDIVDWVGGYPYRVRDS